VELDGVAEAAEEWAYTPKIIPLINRTKNQAGEALSLSRLILCLKVEFIR
jgi:hypothetical protein